MTNPRDNPRSDRFPDHILVIDEIPLVAIGLQEVFRSINPGVRVEYTGNLFTALSAREYEKSSFDLVILGVQASGFSDDLSLPVLELKERFPNSRVLVYTDHYDPILIGKVKAGNGTEGNIDACVHKHEPIEEIRNAYLCLSTGKTYVSAILHTLYHAYRLNLKE
jgi:DNA-binding NarL/FixJ family response regulator